MKKIVSISIMLVLLLCVYTLYHHLMFSDGKLHIVFCDVGQGDAILIISPTGRDVLVDGGPDSRVLDCLSEHMPFWDRELDLVVLTHPHLDHYEGLKQVLGRYSVKAFATEQLKNPNQSFQDFTSLLAEKRIPTRYVSAQDRYLISGTIQVAFISPDQSFLDLTSDNGVIRESGEFASLISYVSYGDFTLLLTGDSQLRQLEQATAYVDNLTVLQVPHHGSKTGLDATLVAALNPKLAVISVGKNSYGHPSPQTLKTLEDEGVRIVRTDTSGSVEIVTDGKTWQMLRD